MKRNKILLAIIVFFSIIFINNLAKATIIDVSPKNPQVGDKVTITVTVPNVVSSNVVTNISGVISGKIEVVGSTTDGNQSTYSKSATYQCTKEGKFDIVVNKDISKAKTKEGKEADVGASVTVNVTANAQSKSSVATLGNLGIKPNDFKGFVPNKTTYSTTVPNSISSIEIYATKGQSGQTISGTGIKELKEGENNFDINVTAEDGKTTKTYNLTVTREKSNSASEENNTSEQRSNTTEVNTTTEENQISEGNGNTEENNESAENKEQASSSNQINETKEKSFFEKIVENKKESATIGIIIVTIIVVVVILIVHHSHNKNNMYYMPYEDGVTEHEDIYQDNIKKESKHKENKKKSKGKRFK